ncbi:MAG: STAS domain-containing protein [Acidobacteria bacterium]|nr:STAS domain-containing protein [Acidobacteriota bacterium]
MPVATRLSGVLERHETDLLDGWLAELQSSGVARTDLMSVAELREQCREFLSLVREIAARGDGDIRAERWSKVRAMLSDASRTRALQGFSPSETATFVLALKRPLWEHLRRAARDGDEMFDDIWSANQLIDELALFTTEVYQKGREEVILRQQRELLELSTPVVKLWDGIVALPLIGTLDSSRTQTVMEALLDKIVETGSQVAIIDITGVPTVDTLVAQHLLKTVAAARLMGAECIISGIRPQIARRRLLPPARPAARPARGSGPGGANVLGTVRSETEPARNNPIDVLDYPLTRDNSDGIRTRLPGNACGRRRTVQSLVES